MSDSEVIKQAIIQTTTEATKTTSIAMTEDCEESRKRTTGTRQARRGWSDESRNRRTFVETISIRLESQRQINRAETF